MSWGARSMCGAGFDGACCCTDSPLVLSQVLLPQPCLFLQLLVRLLLHLVGGGRLPPLPLAPRGPLLPPFTVGGGPLLPLFMAGRVPLLLYSGGVSFQLSVLGAWGLKVHLPG